MGSRNSKICRGVVSVLVLVFFSCLAEARQEMVLVSALDHIPGSFGSKSIRADECRFYAGSGQGDLFAFARNRANNFPLIETINLGGWGIMTVLDDKHNLYVLTYDGKLRIFKKTLPLLQLSSTIQLPTFGSGTTSLSLVDNQFYASIGATRMHVDEKRVYLSSLNEGEIGFGVPGGINGNIFSSRPPVYGRIFAPLVTTVYDRQTAALVGSIPNPIGVQRVALFGDETRLFQTNPGPNGRGIWIYNKCDLSFNRYIPNWYTNAVANVNMPGRDLLVSGTEDGWVFLYDLAAGFPLVSYINLPLVTGHTNPEDIEIRGVFCDGRVEPDGSRLFFAGSSWGNASSQGPNLPSIFVLELR